MQYHGQMALQTALLVAFTQLIPEHQVQVMGVIKARVKVRNFATACPPSLIMFHQDVANGILDPVNYFMLRRLSVSMDYHPVWLVRQLGVSSFLQEESGRISWRW